MRFFDIVFSLIAIAVFSPVLLIIMLILLFSGEHKIFYLQERIGKGFKSFHVFKFVTMMSNSEKMKGGDVTQKNDPRILPLGRVLRHTKLNELPQLFNVFIGQMSVIGPRPLTPSQFYNYSDEQQRAISIMLPGLSGIGSLVFRDEEGIMGEFQEDNSYVHDKIITPFKGDLEVWYYKNKSLYLYFKIIFLTIASILNPKLKIRNSFKDLPKPQGALSHLV